MYYYYYTYRRVYNFRAAAGNIVHFYITSYPLAKINLNDVVVTILKAHICCFLKQ